MYHAYVLKSQKNGRHYIGSCENLEERLSQHNLGRVKSTKSHLPWKIIHFESFPARSEAYRRELEIKSYKGGIKFKKLLGLTISGEVA